MSPKGLAYDVGRVVQEFPFEWDMTVEGFRWWAEVYYKLTGEIA
jgi:hypothetical protein